MSPWNEMRTRFWIVPEVNFHGNFSRLNTLDDLRKDTEAQFSWEFWKQCELFEWLLFRMPGLGKRLAFHIF